MLAMKKKLVGLLACAMIMVLTVSAFAAENQEPVTTLEVAPGEAMAIAEFVVADGEADADMPYTTVVEGVDETGVIETRAVSISKDFSVSVGNSWSTSFDTGKIFVDDHNAFKTIVSDVEGKYKVLITDDKGYAYETEEFNSRGVTLTTTNASSTRTFTVYILNTGTSTLTGHVKISSYYNE
jgi:hypothetical protein